VEVVHARCAGYLEERRQGVRPSRWCWHRKTVETVNTWGSMTSQILALRDHLIAERITRGVMEATSDYWKPFYYLLEDAGFDVLLGNARHVKTSLAARPMSPTRPGWPNSAHTVLCGPRSCHPSRSGSFVI
jgi:transposase